MTTQRGNGRQNPSGGGSNDRAPTVLIVGHDRKIAGSTIILVFLGSIYAWVTWRPPVGLLVPLWLIAGLWAWGRWHRVLRADESGVTVNNGFKERRWPWSDVLGFWVKESGDISGAMFVWWESSDELWITVLGPQRYPVRALSGYRSVYGAVRELNDLLEKMKPGR